MSDEPKVMWSIGQIAERDEISKQAVSKIVRKLVDDHGIPVERDGRGRISAVSLAHYDHHREKFTNPAKRPSGNTPAKTSDPRDSFEEARRQREWLTLERQKIEHQELAGNLVRADTLAAAVEQTGREIQTLVARLENKADDLAIAVSKEGAHGLRIALRKALFDVNEKIADRMDDIAATAPKTEPMIEDSEIA